MILRRAYRFKLEPNREQTSKLYQFAGCRRFVTNWGLARRIEHYKQTGKSLSYPSQAAELTQLKKSEDYPWLKETDAQSLQEALRDVERSFQNFFAKRARFPKFQSKKAGKFSFRIPQRVKVENGKVYCPKIGWIKIRQSQEIVGETKSAVFKRDSCGNWFVTLVSEFEMPDTALPPCEKPVGVDFGLKDFATLSNGDTVTSPRFFQQLARRLGKAQRKLSRAKRGSNRRAKARLKVAKVYRKIANSRADFVHKVSSNLVANFDHIGIEDLNVKALAKTKLRGHAKSWHDAACGEFVRQLEYKAVWNRVRLVKVNRFFPSSKMCGACGVLNDTLKLSDRFWTCCCGVNHHRDLNAANNILSESLCVAVGQTDTKNAHGGCVRLSTKAAPDEMRITCG